MRPFGKGRFAQRRTAAHRFPLAKPIKVTGRAFSLGLLRNQVHPPLDLNHVAHGQFPASPGFHLTVDLDFTTLDQQLRLSTRAGHATELQELVQSQGFTVGGVIG
jgi:hypothetical protein